MGMHVGPMFGALAVLSGIIQARTTGVGLQFEVAQSDAAAAMDWYRSETWRAYERPESEVTGNASDNYERRPAGTAGMREAVRYQIYATGDGHVLFQASEGEFWENFCHALGRGDLLERFPTKRYADHARGNRELQRELRDIFGGRTSAEWIEFGAKANTPIAAVNTPKTIVDDPQFRDRFQFYSVEQLGAEQLPSPIKVVGAALPTPTRAPKVGQHTDEIAREILGYDDVTMAAKRAAGAFGPAST
jgi:crotonobetainyl-CoA:carnitine CoA-transferase CaiB-like acyl-CoA transferase